jgi:hypothetical protein
MRACPRHTPFAPQSKELSAQSRVRYARLIVAMAVSGKHFKLLLRCSSAKEAACAVSSPTARRRVMTIWCGPCQGSWDWSSSAALPPSRPLPRTSSCESRGGVRSCAAHELV